MAAGDITKELRDNVRVRVGEASQSGILDAQIVAYMNAAMDDLLIRVDNAPFSSCTATDTGNLTEAAEPCHTGAVSATLPTDFIREITVFYVDEQANLIEVSRLDEIDNSSHREPSATNVYYYIWDGSLFAEAGAVTTKAYTLHYIQRPTEMSLTVDPTVSDEFHGLIEDFAVARCREQLGQFEEKQRILQHYSNRCLVLNSRWKAPAYEGMPGDAARGGG